MLINKLINNFSNIAILSLYLRNVLLFPENESTVIYHIFIMFCYLIPVLGAILADSYLGRFRCKNLIKHYFFLIQKKNGKLLIFFLFLEQFFIFPLFMQLEVFSCVLLQFHLLLFGQSN